MKILIISNMFPPYIMGGAEMAAHSLALWLAQQGEQVYVLTSAHSRELAGVENMAENLTVERHYFPSVYQIYRAGAVNPLMKAAWHAHDHFHLGAEKITAEVIARFQPDIVNTHSLQGIGYNLLRSVARSGLPCVQTLHDFGFICINTNRFKHNRECDRHHLSCQFSTRIKRSYLEGIARLCFWSPSQALLGVYREHFPAHAKSVAIPLPLIFEHSIPRTTKPHSVTQLLYVGQVTPWKGVAFILEVIHQLPADLPFQMNVIGGGSDLAALQEKYQADSRIVFHGKLPPENVGAHMAGADLLLTPSLWFENAPLVISQAIQLHLPVFASRVGGLPELVEDGISGRLLPLGDQVSWEAALREVLANPTLLTKWRNGTADLATRFSTQNLGERVLDLFEETIGNVQANPQPVLLSC